MALWKKDNDTWDKPLLPNSEVDIVSLTRKVRDLTDEAKKLIAKFDGVLSAKDSEILGLRQELRTKNEFLENVILQLIKAPSVASAPTEPKTALEKYIAKKAANGDTKSASRLPG